MQFVYFWNFEKTHKFVKIRKSIGILYKAFLLDRDIVTTTK